MGSAIIIEPANAPENPGWFYAHIPALDLTTHGYGIEGAMDAARDLATGWIAELRDLGRDVPTDLI
jgi:hypothetical protein